MPLWCSTSATIILYTCYCLNYKYITQRSILSKGFNKALCINNFKVIKMFFEIKGFFIKINTN